MTWTVILITVLAAAILLPPALRAIRRWRLRRRGPELEPYDRDLRRRIGRRRR